MYIYRKLCAVLNKSGSSNPQKPQLERPIAYPKNHPSKTKQDSLNCA